MSPEIRVTGFRVDYLLLKDGSGEVKAKALRDDSPDMVPLAELPEGALVTLGNGVKDPGNASDKYTQVDLRQMAALFPEIKVKLGKELPSATASWHKSHEEQCRSLHTSLPAHCETCSVDVLREAMRRDEEHPESLQAFGRIDLPAIAVLDRSTAAGLVVDLDGLCDLDGKLVREQCAAREIVEKAYPGIDPTKDAQLERYLRKITPWSAPSGYDDSAEHELPRRKHLERLAQGNPSALAAKTVRDIGVLREQLSRLCALRLSTGRLHPTYTLGSATGRFHTSGAGCLQNIKKELRRYIRAGAGMTFIVADFQAFEIGPMACLAREDRLLEALRAGKDLHREVAASVFKVAPEDVADAQRDIGKRLNFLIPFGGEAGALAENAGITLKEALAHLTAYDERYPDLAGWLKTTRERVAAGQKFSRLPSGRLLALGDGDERQRQRRAIAYQVQGTAADIAKLALVRVAKELAAKDLGYVAIFLHDEIVAQVPEDRAQEAKEVIEKAMIVAPEWMPEVPLRVDAEIRKTWGRPAPMKARS